MLVTVRDYFKRPSSVEDRYDLFGKTIAMRLRALDKRQQLLAEKIIYDTMFEAEMGNINTQLYQYQSQPSLIRSTCICSPTISPNSNTTGPSLSPSPLLQQYTTKNIGTNSRSTASSKYRRFGKCTIFRIKQ